MSENKINAIRHLRIAKNESTQAFHNVECDEYENILGYIDRAIDHLETARRILDDEEFYKDVENEEN